MTSARDKCALSVALRTENASDRRSLLFDAMIPRSLISSRFLLGKIYTGIDDILYFCVCFFFFFLLFLFQLPIPGQGSRVRRKVYLTKMSWGAVKFSVHVV